jgi:putative acetyltransferase
LGGRRRVDVDSEANPRAYLGGREPTEVCAAMIEIRTERPGDLEAIRDVNERAFGGHAEATLVDHLRAANKAAVSIVAELGDRVVGHILFSPVTIANNPDGVRGAGLAPMSVLPEYQNRGIGSRLVRDGLIACREIGFDLVVVLGHSGFYPRFGFAPAESHGLGNEYNASDAFMVLELRAGALEGTSGMVTFAPEFREAGC